MSLSNLPAPLDSVFADTENLPVFFDRLMMGMIEVLQCDRCYLYLRDPKFYYCQISHCYCVHPEIPNLAEPQKQTESYYRSKTDPLFAAALNCEPNIFIEDMARAFKERDCYDWQQNYFEPQALIQAHVFSDNELWGIMRIAQFKRPRPWTSFDRNIISTIVDRITPLVTIYVRRELRGTIQVLHDGDR